MNDGQRDKDKNSPDPFEELLERNRHLKWPLIIIILVIILLFIFSDIYFSDK